MASPDTLLEVRNLERRTRDGDVLLAGIDLTIRAGERWAIGGPTGAGKSLLLRSLALLDHSEGELLWRGRPVQPSEIPAYRSKVTYLAQNVAVIDGTVEDNLRLPLSLKQHHEASWPEDRILDWCRRFQKDRSFLSRDSSDLSGGERQMVSLMRALIIEPTLLLVDEGTSALDSKSVNVFEDMIDEWLHQQSEDRAVVWVTHSQELTDRVADRILSLEGGRMRETVA
ncbi:MAG: ATP-binding cassette domain-containing protein [Planctomycetaceae bacterium]|nr:ATP-binding cassette domain-containing protein [Planctomycetaceae bacterium]